MKKKTTQELLLEKECSILREALKRFYANPPEIPFGACDNSCIIAHPTGVQTNGGCRCDGPKLRSALMYWRNRSAYLQEIVRGMRDGDPIRSWDDTYKAMYERMLEREAK